MRKSLLAGLCLLFSSAGLLFAQNKTLGVGVTTPNSNAALHVESPTGNQGFIMPRLTTAQRNAMTSLLTAADKGLMLYDTDLSTIYIWDGVSWGSASEFSIDNPASVDDAMEAFTVGSGSAGRFTINNTSSFAHAVYAESNGDSSAAAVYGNNIGQGFGVFGRSASSKFSSAAVYGEHIGTGDAAGAFRIANASSTYSALYGETNGSGPAVYGNQIGLGRGGQFQITNGSNTQAALRSYTAGTGNAGFYTVNNAASDSSAIYSTTNGLGAAISGLTTGSGYAIKGVTSTGFSAIYGEAPGGVSNGVSGVSRSSDPGSYAVLGQNSGAGPAGVFSISSGTNSSAALAASTSGTGPAGSFVVNNSAHDAPALIVTTNGPGTAFRGENSGAGDGFAGNFEITNPTNTYPAIQASSAGAGSGVRVMQSAGPGAGVDVFMQNLSSNGTGVFVDQKGLGEGGSFVVDNASNTRPAVNATTNGTGFAVNARHNGLSGDAIYAEHAGATGSAGNFRISGVNNSASALYASTASPGGNAMSVRNDANGIAFTIWQGGLQITTSDITTGTSLATRASAYRITSTAGTTFTIDFGPVNGEVFMIFNDTAQPITIPTSGINTTIAAGEGKTFISFNGTIRGL